MDETTLREMFEFFVYAKAVVESEEVAQFRRLLQPLQGCINTLEAIDGGLSDKLLAKCRLLELRFRRLRERISRAAQKEWLRAQLILPN